MDAAQPEPSRTRTSRRRERAARKQHTTESEAAPLAHLQRRYAAGAIGTGTAYLAVLTTTVVRPNAIQDPVAIGLLVGFGTVAGLCTLGAILTWMMSRLPALSNKGQAEEVEWAIRLGEELADAYRAAPAGGSASR